MAGLYRRPRRTAATSRRRRAGRPRPPARSPPPAGWRSSRARSTRRAGSESSRPSIAATRLETVDDDVNVTRSAPSTASGSTGSGRSGRCGAPSRRRRRRRARRAGRRALPLLLRRGCGGPPTSPSSSRSASPTARSGTTSGTMPAGRQRVGRRAPDGGDRDPGERPDIGRQDALDAVRARQDEDVEAGEVRRLERSGSIRMAGASVTAAPSSSSRARRPLACARARVTTTRRPWSGPVLEPRQVVAHERRPRRPP